MFSPKSRAYFPANAGYSLKNPFSEMFLQSSPSMKFDTYPCYRRKIEKFLRTMVLVFSEQFNVVFVYSHRLHHFCTSARKVALKPFVYKNGAVPLLHPFDTAYKNSTPNSNRV